MTSDEATPTLAVRLEIAEREIDRLRDSESATRAVADLRRDYESFRERVELRMAEYDKERTLAGRLGWPIVIALLTAGAVGVFVLLLKVNGIIGA